MVFDGSDRWFVLNAIPVNPKVIAMQIEMGTAGGEVPGIAFLLCEF